MLLQMAYRNLRRNSKRSGLTVLTVTLGCGLFVIAISWVYGIQNNLTQSIIQNNGQVRIATEAFIKNEAHNPIDENLPKTDQLVEQLNHLDTIKAYSRIKIAAAASVGGRELGDVFTLINGADIGFYEDILQLDKVIESGTFFASQNDVLVGWKLAQEMNIEVGDDAIFIGETQDSSPFDIKFRTAGIIKSGNVVIDRQAFVALSETRYMADMDGATEILIYGSESAEQTQKMVLTLAENLTGLTDSFDEDGQPFAIVVQTWKEREPFGAMLLLFRALNLFLASLIIFITALGMLNTMMMSVIERTNEIGILRAMGMGKSQTALLFVLEGILIALIGGIIGTLLGSIMAIWMEQYGINLGETAANAADTLSFNSIIYPDWRIELALISFMTAILMGVLGTVIPALRATRFSPSQTMNNK